MVDLLQSKKVKIRKTHICQGCGKRLEKGEIVQAETLADDGEIYRLYHCDECWDWWEKECNNCSELRAGYCIAEHYPIGAIRDCRREREANE